MERDNRRYGSPIDSLSQQRLSIVKNADGSTSWYDADLTSSPGPRSPWWLTCSSARRAAPSRGGEAPSLIPVACNRQRTHKGVAVRPLPHRRIFSLTSASIFLATLAGVFLTGPAANQPVEGATPSHWKTVQSDGISISVPSSWPVADFQPMCTQKGPLVQVNAPSRYVRARLSLRILQRSSVLPSRGGRSRVLFSRAAHPDRDDPRTASSLSQRSPCGTAHHDHRCLHPL